MMCGSLFKVNRGSEFKRTICKVALVICVMMVSMQLISYWVVLSKSSLGKAFIKMADSNVLHNLVSWRDSISQSKTPPGGVKKVILVTYFRGGSSLLGETFNQNPDVFYWFEPLHEKAYQWKTFRNLAKSSHSKDSLQWTYTQEATESNRLLANILNCNLTADDPVLTDSLLIGWRKSLKAVPYQNCIHPYFKNQSVTIEVIQKCLPLLISACQNSSIRVLKAIRYHLNMVPEILLMDPTIQFVYSPRDPRGMLVSIAQLGAPKVLSRPKWIISKAEDRCPRIHDDFLWFQKLRAHYDNLIVATKYEDLAMDPIATVEHVYNNLSIPLPERVRTWIKVSTSWSGDNGALGTKRANSSLTAVAWRRLLVNDSLAEANRLCGHIVRELKYPL